MDPFMGISGFSNLDTRGCDGSVCHHETWHYSDLFQPRPRHPKRVVIGSGNPDPKMAETFRPRIFSPILGRIRLDTHLW